MPPNKFSEGERVLCFHGALIYEAKCLKHRSKADSGDHEYYVHYAGWSKKWDEWVQENRVLKYNDMNLEKQKDLQKSQTGDKKTKAKAKGGRSGTKGTDSQESDFVDGDSRSSTPILDPRSRIKSDKKRSSPTADIIDKAKKKLRLDHPIQSEAQFLSKVEVKIKIPDALKSWLVEDCLTVVKKKKLFILPAKVTVDKILNSWVKSKKNLNSATISREVSEGIREYFNTMLPNKLLFNDEREQYNEVVGSGDALPSSIYGSAHLLRLFTKLGHVLAYTVLNEKTMSLLVSALSDLLRFMATEVAVMFSVDNYS